MMTPTCPISSRSLRNLWPVMAVAVTVVLSGCPLEGAPFGRACEASDACGDAFICSSGFCVPERLTDGGSARDAGPTDAGALDAGEVDAGPADAGDVDGGAPDAGALDAGEVDAGPADAGGLDAGPADAGDVDGGPFDAGTFDGGPVGQISGEVILRPEGLARDSDFGDAIAVSGNDVAIGAPGQNTVYLYRVQNGTVELHQTIRSDSADDARGFGSALAMYDNLLVIGVPFQAVADQESAGRVEIWRRAPNGTYGLDGELVAPILHEFTYFGRSVAIKKATGPGEVILVGEPNARGTENRVGAVHVFTRGILGGLSPDTSVFSPNPETSASGNFNRFGEDVAFSPVGNDFAVSAPGERPTPGFARSGRVYVFRRGLTDTALEQTLQGDNIATQIGYYGASIAFTPGGNLLVGFLSREFPPAPPDEPEQGVILQYNGASAYAPAVDSEIFPAANPSPVYFGASIAVDEQGMVVGAVHPANNFTNVAPGEIFRMMRGQNQDWVEDTNAPKPIPNFGSDDRYGAAVAQNDSVVFVGAPTAIDIDGFVYGAVVAFPR